MVRGGVRPRQYTTPELGRCRAPTVDVDGPQVDGTRSRQSLAEARSRTQMVVAMTRLSASRRPTPPRVTLSGRLCWFSSGG